MGIVKVIPYFRWYRMSREDRVKEWEEFAQRNRSFSGRVEVRQESTWELIRRLFLS